MSFIVFLVNFPGCSGRGGGCWSPGLEIDEHSSYRENKQTKKSVKSQSVPSYSVLNNRFLLLVNFMRVDLVDTCQQWPPGYSLSATIMFLSQNLWNLDNLSKMKLVGKKDLIDKGVEKVRRFKTKRDVRLISSSTYLFPSILSVPLVTFSELHVHGAAIQIFWKIVWTFWLAHTMHACLHCCVHSGLLRLKGLFLRKLDTVVKCKYTKSYICVRFASPGLSSSLLW